MWLFTTKVIIIWMPVTNELSQRFLRCKLSPMSCHFSLCPVWSYFMSSSFATRYVLWIIILLLCDVKCHNTFHMMWTVSCQWIVTLSVECHIVSEMSHCQWYIALFSQAMQNVITLSLRHELPPVNCHIFSLHSWTQGVSFPPPE